MNHHTPQLSKNFELETAIVHLSNIIALARGILLHKEAEKLITSSQEIFASENHEIKKQIQKILKNKTYEIYFMKCQ